MYFIKYKHKYFSIIICAFLIAIDYITKQLALMYIPRNSTVTVIPYLFDFNFLFNDGAAFGILDDKRWVFMIATIVFLVLGIIYFITLKPNQKYLTYVIMIIIAGGIGNMIDRVTTGQVIDFITFGFIDFPSFNFADCCVVIGCILWIAYLVFEIINEKRQNINE